MAKPQAKRASGHRSGVGKGLVSATTTEQDGHQHKERHATASMPTVPAGPPPLASWRRQSEGGGHHDASHIPKPPLRVQKASPPRGPESVAGSGVLSPGSERKRQEALSLASTASPTKAPLESMLDKLPSSEALPGRPMPQRSTSQTGSHDSSRRETSPCRPSGRQLPPPMLIHSTSARNLLRGASAETHSRKSPTGKLDPLPDIPTTPIVVLADGVYQEKGIAGQKAGLSVVVVNAGKLQQPVTESDFTLQHLQASARLSLTVKKQKSPGRFRMNYWSLSPGTFVFSILCRGRALQGKVTEFTVTIEKPYTCAKMCIARGPGIKVVPALKITQFDILVRDQQGYARAESDGDNFTVDFTGPQQCELAAIGPFHSGRYTVSYMALKAGIYRLDINLNGKPIGGSPYFVDIKGGDPVPENTRVLLEELPGDKSIIAGERGLVHMCCFDAKENLDTSGCANLRISLVHEMHSDEVLVGKYEGHEDGLYTFSFFARVAGRYHVRGEHEQGQTFLPVRCNEMAIVGSGAIDAKTCYVSTATPAGNLGVPTTSTVGEWMEFSIQAVDRYGNLRDTQVHQNPLVKITCQLLDDPDLVSVEDADASVRWEAGCNGNGTIDVRYAVDFAGRYVCQVVVGGSLLCGTSFPTHFIATELDAGACIVNGFGLNNALVGVTSSIAVESRDRFNNRVRHGESPLQVRVVPESRARPAGPAESKPKEAIVEIHDDDSGIFLIDIIPQDPGMHSVSIMYTRGLHTRGQQGEEHPLIGSKVLQMKVGNASTVEGQAAIIGGGFEGAVAGKEQAFTLCSLTAESNSKSDVGGDSFNVFLQLVPGTSKQAKLYRHLQGFGGMVPARNGKRERHSPTAGRTKTAAIGAMATALMRKIAADLKKDRAKASSRLTQLDLGMYSSEEEDGDEVTVEGHVEDMGDGSYAVTYTPFIAGTYLLLVEKNGQALYLPGERQLIEVLPGEIDGPSSIILGAGKTSAEAGVPAGFRVQGSDSYGNAVEVGALSGFQFEIYKEFVPPEQEEDTVVPVEVTDYGKGQLNVTYTAELAGSYIIEAKINGVAQPELEGRVMISPTVPDCSKCKVYGEGLHRAVAGYIASFCITTHDRFGNECDKGGENFVMTLQLVEAVKGLNQDIPSGPIMLKAIDNNDGTYRVYYRVKVAGQFNLQISLANDSKAKHTVFEGHVIVCPFKVTTHDFHGNCVALDHKPPQELLRFGQDLHAYLSHGEAAPPAALKPGLDEPHGDAKDVLSGFADAYQAKMETGFLGLTASLSSADSGEHSKTSCTASRLVLQDTRGGGKAVSPGDDKLTTYVLKYTPPRPGLFMLDVRIWGKHILGSPFTVQAIQEHILGAFAATQDALEYDAERALMFARIKREEGVPVFHRKLGESTVSTNVASIDTSLLTSSKWDASTSSALRELGLRATCATTASRIKDLERFSRYEQRKQSALLHMRITNLRHAFGEGSADDDDAALHRLHPLPSNITEESPDPPAGGGDLPFGLIGDPQTTTRPAPNTSLGKGLQGGAVGRVRGSSPNIKLRKAAMAFRWAGSARAKKGTVAARLAETLDAKIREPVW